MNEQPIGTAARSWSFEELREKVRHWLLDRFDRSQIGEVTDDICTLEAWATTRMS